MSSATDIFRKMIVEKALVTVQKNNQNKNYLVLKEDASSPQYSVRILHTPDDTIAIKSDVFSFPIKIFQCMHNECKRADYVIIAHDEGKKWIVYVELKKGRCNNSHIVNQLKGSKCFVEYCRVIGQTFFDDPEFLDANDYLSRYVSIKVINFDKKPFRRKEKPPLHDTPQNMLPIISHPEKKIMFKMLIQPED
ncbi:MAG: hypothetical protein OXF06_11030 [Bacteroidetes bacterium]|nr:hypothetical protein [Bacteroidota bacterium]